VSGRGDEIGMFHRTGMQAGGDQAGDVRDIGQQISADFSRNFPIRAKSMTRG